MKFTEFKACPLGGHPGAPVRHHPLPADFRRMGHALREREAEMCPFRLPFLVGGSCYRGRVCVIEVFRGGDEP